MIKKLCLLLVALCSVACFDDGKKKEYELQLVALGERWPDPYNVHNTFDFKVTWEIGKDTGEQLKCRAGFDHYHLSTVKGGGLKYTITAQRTNTHGEGYMYIQLWEFTRDGMALIDEGEIYAGWQGTFVTIEGRIK
jgi:hypothetical protein